MARKALNLASDLHEQITYDSNQIPMVICVDRFDDYSNREWTCHWHEEFEMLTVRQGSLECTFYQGVGNPTTLALKSGDAVFINSCVLHSVKAIEPNTTSAGFVLPMNFFDIRAIQSLGSKIMKPITESVGTHFVISCSDTKNEKLLDAISELCDVDSQKEWHELYCIEMMCRIWRLLANRIAESRAILQNDDVNDSRMKEMLSYVHENFGQHLSVQDIAQSGKVSRTECFKLFQNILHKTPTEYLNEYRLSTAAMLLTHSQKSITDIALSCGFGDTSYFSKIFRKQYGVTPREYRK